MLHKFGSSCGFTLHSDADFVLMDYRYMFNESNTCIKVNHKIITLPIFYIFLDTEDKIAPII